MQDLQMLIILASSLPLCRPINWWDTYTKLYFLGKESDEEHMKRLGVLLRGIAERGEARFSEITRIKTAIDEESLDQRRAFEKGYVMGDVIETYRKALVYTQKQLVKQKNRYQEQDRLRFMMYLQTAYIKVYHLVHMMHEINPKFGSDNTGQITEMNMNYQMKSYSPTFYNMAGFNYTKVLNEMRAERHKMREAKIEKEKRARQVELELDGTVKPGTIKKTTNWWPVAYGWDIDYYW